MILFHCKLYLVRKISSFDLAMAERNWKMSNFRDSSLKTINKKRVKMWCFFQLQFPIRYFDAIVFIILVCSSTWMIFGLYDGYKTSLFCVNPMMAGNKESNQLLISMVWPSKQGSKYKSLTKNPLERPDYLDKPSSDRRRRGREDQPRRRGWARRRASRRLSTRRHSTTRCRQKVDRCWLSTQQAEKRSN